MASEPDEGLQARLANVLWVGGSTDAGKTSVARALAERHGWQAYHYDLYDRPEPPGHWARIDPDRHPAMHAWFAKDKNARWVETTPREMVAEWLRTASERFRLTLEDLQVLPATPPVVAEGYGFLPDLVLPLLSAQHQAIWLVSTADFKRASYERRGKGRFLAGTGDLERARRNHIGRDLLLAAYVRERAQALGLTVIDVDETRSLEQVTALVEAHFASHVRGD